MNRFVPLFLVIASLSFPSFLHAADAEPVLPGTLSYQSVTVDHLDRTFLVYIPSGELKSPALIIALHGTKWTGEIMRDFSGLQFDRLAEKEKCIIAYPDGYEKHWNDCRTKPDDEAHVKNIDDVGFMNAIIDRCSSKWHIDQKKVYAVGFSNGGHLCFMLASEPVVRVAGIAAIGANMPVSGSSRCITRPPRIPVMIVNGTDDPINPFEGGTVRLFWFFSKGDVVSSMESARMWLRPEDKDKAPVIEMLPDRDPSDKIHVEKLSWPTVALYIIHGGGHTIPGGTQYLPLVFVGPVCRDMNVAEEAWNFFKKSGTK